MEEKCILEGSGKRVQEIRTGLKMNRQDFYDYLFPNNGKSLECKKKKVYDVEKGCSKKIDMDFMLAVCEKENLSMDYLLGFIDDFSYDLKHVCEYTGLDANAVKRLHYWNENQNSDADLSILTDGYCGFGNVDELYAKAHDKQVGMQLLRLVNFLFKDHEIVDNKKKRPHISILYDLNQLIMIEPNEISGELKLDEDDIRIIQEVTPWYFNKPLELKIDASKTCTLSDKNNVFDLVLAKDLLRQAAWEYLKKDIDALIEDMENE